MESPHHIIKIETNNAKIKEITTFQFAKSVINSKLLFNCELITLLTQSISNVRLKIFVILIRIHFSRYQKYINSKKIANNPPKGIPE